MRLRCYRPLLACAVTMISLAAVPPLSAQCATSAPKVEVQQANGQIQVQVRIDPRPCGESYGAWTTLPGVTTRYREYEYTIDGVRQHHYLVWFPSDPAHCYCYNRQTRQYWGRWNNEVQQTTFTRTVRKSTTVAEAQFEQQTVAAIAPGTAALMTPPAFPTDLPPDVLRP